MAYKPKTHQKYFDLDGNPLKGVTTITGRHPDGKAAMLAKAVSLTKEGIDHKALWSHKALIGTCCHEIIHHHIMELGKPDLSMFAPNVVKPAKVGYRAFKKWERQAKPVYLASEAVVINNLRKYGGTLDIWAVICGKVSVIDLKTGGWWATAEMQIKAYEEALIDEIVRSREMQCVLWEHGTPIGLQLDCNKGSYTVHHFSQSAMDNRWKQFLNLLEGMNLEKE